MPLGSKPALHPKIFSVHVSSHTTSDREPVSSHKTSDRQPATASVPAPGKRSGAQSSLDRCRWGPITMSRITNASLGSICFTNENTHKLKTRWASTLRKFITVQNTFAVSLYILMSLYILAFEVRVQRESTCSLHFSPSPHFPSGRKSRQEEKEEPDPTWTTGGGQLLSLRSLYRCSFSFSPLILFLSVPSLLLPPPASLPLPGHPPFGGDGGRPFRGGVRETKN